MNRRQQIENVVKTAESVVKEFSVVGATPMQMCTNMELALAIQQYKSARINPKLKKLLSTIEDWFEHEDIGEGDIETLETILNGLTWSEKTRTNVIETKDKILQHLEENNQSFGESDEHFKTMYSSSKVSVA